LAVAAQLLVVALLLYLAWSFARRLDFGLLLARLGEVGAGAVALMSLGLLLRLPIWTARWHYGTRSAQLHAPGWAMVGALAASMAVNTITPTARVAGGLVRARFLANEARCGFGVAYGTVLVDQLLHHAAQGVLGVLSVAAAAGGRAPVWSAAAVVVVLVFVSAVALHLHRGAGGGSAPSLVDRVLARTQRRLERQAARQPRLGAALAGSGDAIEVTARLLRDRSVLVSGALLGIALFLVNGAVQWVAFRSLGLHVGFAAALVVVGIGGFAGVASGTPGGAGGAEAAMIATLAALGVSTVDATVATLLFRGLHYVWTLGIGLPSLFVLEWRRTRARREATA
jgi:uncharacterized protein (TIRG00374 family)